MKECVNCKNLIPDDASFCFECTASQVNKQTIKLPVLRKKKILITLVVLAGVVAVAILVWIFTGIKEIDSGGAELIYKSHDIAWHLLLRNDTQDAFHWKTPQETYSRIITEDTQAAIPLQLYVYDDQSGESAADDFMDQLESVQVMAIAGEGSEAAQCCLPEQSASFPKAALVSDIIYDKNVTDNDIVWKIKLKNGSVLVLHEKVDITVMHDVIYSWDSMPLDTTEQVQELIDSVTVKDTENIIINLAPKEYLGDLNLNGKNITINGSRSDDAETLFHGCIYYPALDHNSAPGTISNIKFEGAETGICMETAVFVDNCIFSNLDTGIDGREGSWPMVFDCKFENCRTGLYFNSTSSNGQSAYYEGNVFRSNDTAILLENVPGSTLLYFIDFIFENNGTDVDNRSGCDITFTLD